MSILDDLFGPDEKKIKKAYGKGVKDQQKADVFDKFVHAIEDQLNNELHWRDKEAQAREAGWHDSEKGKLNWESKPKPRSSEYPLKVFGFSEADQKVYDKFAKTFGWIVIVFVGVPIIITAFIYLIAIIYGLTRS